MSGSDLVLHVGMPRSGPPLRQALRALRPQLHAHAVAFLGREELNRLPHTKAWHSNGRPRAAHADAFSRELRAAVYTERQAAAGVMGLRSVQLVLSSDRLAGSGPLGLADSERFRPHAERAIAHVIESLAARRVRVILYTHRQDRLMELAYLRRIQAGDRHSFAEQFPYRFEAVLDYLDLIDRLRTVPQVTDVVVRPVEFLDAGTHAFTNDFLSAVGLEDALDLYALGSDLSIHPGVYSGTAARLALAIRALLESDEEIRLVNSFLAKNYAAGERYTTDVLDQDERRRILECYAERNAELFRTQLPELPADSYADDTSTFQLANLVGPAGVPAPHTLLARVGGLTAARVTASRVMLTQRTRHVAARVRRRIRGAVR